MTFISTTAEQDKFITKVADIGDIEGQFLDIIGGLDKQISTLKDQIDMLQGELDEIKGKEGKDV